MRVCQTLRQKDKNEETLAEGFAERSSEAAVPVRASECVIMK